MKTREKDNFSVNIVLRKGKGLDLGGVGRSLHVELCRAHPCSPVLMRQWNTKVRDYGV